MDHFESQEEGMSSQLTLESHLAHVGKEFASSLHPRLAWMMFYEETRSVQAVAERFGISRKTFYKWYKRYKQSNGSAESLSDRSRRPHHSPRATSESNIRLLKHVKEETGFGQRRLRAYLEQKYQVHLSERTIWKILKTHGVNGTEVKA
jgi:transposase